MLYHPLLEPLNYVNTFVNRDVIATPQLLCLNVPYAFLVDVAVTDFYGSRRESKANAQGSLN